MRPRKSRSTGNPRGEIPVRWYRPRPEHRSGMHSSTTHIDCTYQRRSGERATRPPSSSPQGHGYFHLQSLYQEGRCFVYDKSHFAECMARPRPGAQRPTGMAFCKRQRGCVGQRGRIVYRGAVQGLDQDPRRGANRLLQGPFAAISGMARTTSSLQPSSREWLLPVVWLGVDSSRAS